MEKENLHFKIGLSGTSPSKSPEFKIYINDKEYVNSKLSVQCNETEFFEFDVEITEGPNNLVIEFLNKTSTDTIKNDAGEIIADFLLNVDLIEIDDVDITNLKWTLSDYYPIYPKNYSEIHNPPEVVKNCVNLGWNGRWVLPFQSPFYIWLLENI
jgi:hypothetical protein